MIEELSDDTWDEKVTKRKGWIMVDFWRPECGPCRMLGVVLQDIDQKPLALKPVIAKINLNMNGKASKTFGIRVLPTMILFKDGKEVERMAGVMTATMMQTWFNRRMSNVESKEEPRWKSGI